MIEIEKLASNLPEAQRALLVEHLLSTLSPILQDEGEEEAARRDEELNANPGIGLSLEELDQRIANRRG